MKYLPTFPWSFLTKNTLFNIGNILSYFSFIFFFCSTQRASKNVYFRPIILERAFPANKEKIMSSFPSSFTRKQPTFILLERGSIYKFPTNLDYLFMLLIHFLLFCAMILYIVFDSVFISL
jgi:hypothetical protein